VSRILHKSRYWLHLLLLCRQQNWNEAKVWSYCRMMKKNGVLASEAWWEAWRPSSKVDPRAF